MKAIKSGAGRYGAEERLVKLLSPTAVRVEYARRRSDVGGQSGSPMVPRPRASRHLHAAPLKRRSSFRSFRGIRALPADTLMFNSSADARGTRTTTTLKQTQGGGS